MADGQDMNGPLAGLGQVVLVFQGGGALGAYQAGVYQALHEAGIEPDWVIGTSIGAINAALIAGNPRERRIEALEAFWSTMRHASVGALPAPFAEAARLMNAFGVFGAGLPGFFAPNPMAFAAPHLPMRADAASYYSTRPLRRTLDGLVDFDHAQSSGVRLTVGAANVATGQMRYFDSRRESIAVEHVLASGALPPAFPAVEIDGELYWDGGVLSNTPVEAVFDDNPRRDSIVFAVHMWRPDGAAPSTLWQVANREKDLRYASRASSHIQHQRNLHRLRRIISALADRLPPELVHDAEVQEMRSWGCTTKMQVVRLMAPRLPNEDQLKDIDFSHAGVTRRWEAGLEDMREALTSRPWRDGHDPVEGFVLHEIADAGATVSTVGASR